MIIMITMDIMRTVKKIIMFLPVLKMKSLQSTHFIHMELFAMWINLEVGNIERCITALILIFRFMS